MEKRAYSVTLWLASTSLVAFVACPSVAIAQQTAQLSVDLPEQRLADSLRALALLSGRTVLADDGGVAGRRAPALHGTFTLEQALDRLLAGTGLKVEAAGNGFVVRGAARGGKESAAGGDDIVVTGTRLRGTEVASQVIVLGNQTLQDSGFGDLGDAARNIPQSFGGGQNPGIGLNVPASAGANAGGGSTVNLRGLGSDATLTILNGRRLPYDTALQGVDISAIPLAAVDRIEVVADGSSAIYGSDAVGGVVNVILRQDYEGLQTRARIGGATEGGDFQQLYGVLAGHRWNGGGMFVTYEYNRNTELNSNQRDSTVSHPNMTLLPASQRHAVAAHLHQDLVTGLTFEGDVLYNERTGSLTYPLNAASDPHVSRVDQSYNSYSLALAGALHYRLGRWEVTAAGTYGKGRNDLLAEYVYSDVTGLTSAKRYRNRSTTGELAASGPVFHLPGGDARIAAGLGIRDNGFEIYAGPGNYQNAKPSETARYVFGELNLPLISPDLAVPLVRKLTLSGALRHEDYDTVGEITTPKLGLIYAPVDALELKATWGRSFRAPSFYDQYGAQTASLYAASRLGGIGYPASATAILLGGGNQDLKPERARSWSATASFHPAALEGATFEVTYFSTNYVNRVVTPITLTAQSLSNPIYAQQVSLNPSASQQASIISGVDQFYNFTTGAYDPSQVVAIIDNRKVNAGRQTVHGIDALAQYSAKLAGGTAAFDLNATYLVSERQLSDGQPIETLAGYLYNPPHWRGRAAASWDDGSWRLTGTLSYIGGVVDTRASPPDKVHGMTTLDLSARYRFIREGSVLDGLEVGVSANNLFNAMPAQITTTTWADTPYDSTNYSPVGRFLALEVVKKW